MRHYQTITLRTMNYKGDPMTKNSYDTINDAFMTLHRLHLKTLLGRCTTEQIALFNKMYGSADNVKLKDMSWAISQIERTLAKNRDTA